MPQSSRPVKPLQEDFLCLVNSVVPSVDAKHKTPENSPLITESPLQKELQPIPPSKTGHNNLRTILEQAEKLPFRAVMKVSASNALQCFEDCKCRCHYR